MNERETIELILETVKDHLIYAEDLNMRIVEDDFMLTLSEQEYNFLDDLCAGSLASKKSIIKN